MILLCFSALAFAQEALSDFSIIFENNIFDNERGQVPTVKFSLTVAPIPPEPEYIGLVGAVVHQYGAAAFFEASDQANAGFYAQGEQIAGFFLSDIHSSGVLLVDGEREVALPVGCRLSKQGEEQWRVEPAPYRVIERQELTVKELERRRER